MPISSAQISGLIGGQQVMFSNQAAMAQQIGGMYGTGPMMPGPSQNPYPSFGIPGYGAQGVNSPGGVGPLAVGTAGMALPGIAAGISMAGGFAGGAAGYLDPFTGVARAAARGAGVGGQGFFGGLGALGSVFTGQGAMAGLSAVGRGMAFGAAAALPYYAAGEAISYVGENIYQGAQNVSQVGEIMGRQGPFYGQGGFRAGGGMGRGQIRDIVQILHDITGDADLNATMSQLTQLASKAQQGGMLTGVMNASDFKQKFTTIVNQVKEVAQIMGTSLDEAMPVLSQMRQMGMWRTSDVMGTAHALNQVGRTAAPQLLASMQAGANISWQQGGSLGAGASIGRNAFMQVQAATQAGVLPQEAIMELTGGVGGVQGQRMVAGTLGRGVSTFAQSAAGRALIAGLGEMEGGGFTGRIDQQRLQQFMSGGMDIGEVLAQGRGRTRGREAAVSFQVRGGQIGQELMSQGGMGAVAQAVQGVMEKAGYGEASDSVRNMFLQKMMGVNAREAELWKRMIDDLPQIQEQADRRARDAIDDQFRKLDVRQNRSWQGFKDAMGHAMQQAVGRPIQEASATVATRMGQSFDRLSDYLYGRTRKWDVGAGESKRMLMQHGLPGLQAQAAGMDVTRRVDMDTSISQALRMDPTGTLGRAVVGAMGPIGTAVAAFGMESTTVRGEFERAGIRTDEEARVWSQRAAMRALNPSMQALGLGSGGENRKKVDRIKTRIGNMLTDPRLSNKLRQAKEDAGASPEGYMQRFMAILKEDPSIAADLGDLDANDQRDLVAAAQAEGGFGNKLIAPITGQARAIRAGLFGTREELQKDINAASEGMAERIREANTSTAYKVGVGLLKGAAVAALAIPGVGVLAAGALGAGGLLAETAFSGITSEEWSEAVQNEEWGGDMLRWIQGGMQSDKDNRFLQKVKEGDETARKLHEMLSNVPPDQLSKYVQTIQAGRAAIVSQERVDEIKTMAGREMSRLSVLKSKGVSSAISKRYEDILKAYKSGDVTGAGAMAQKLARDVSRDSKALSAISGQGAIGGFIKGLAGLERFAEAGGTDAVGRERFSKQFRRLGLGFDLETLMEIPEFKEDIAGMLASGGEVTREERAKIVDIARKVAVERAGPRSGRTETAQQEKLYNLLTSYASAHERFVWAVAAAETSMASGEKEDLMKKVNEMQKLGGRK